jgi:mono/diheme cytochrome c family protein
MIAWTDERKRTLRITGIVLLLILALLGWFAWYKFFRVVPQPAFNSADERFMYGSVGAEESAGIPYWILYVLPRVFPDKVAGNNSYTYPPRPGPAGFASFGVAWQFGKEWPVGFTQKTIGFERVANNCATCHVATYRRFPNDETVFVPTGPNHTFNLEGFFRFLVDCARDPRFNADAIMHEIDLNSDLSWIDKLLYRYIYIPATRKALLARGPRFQWIYFHTSQSYWPDWGRGRDDAMNLTKYFLTTSPVDQTLGPTDMPSIWNIGKYKAIEEVTGRKDSTRMNFAGDSYDANSVIIDSALGLVNAQPRSNKEFLAEKDWLYKYISSYKAPKFREVFPKDKFPKALDDTKIEKGKAVFAQNCAVCHWSQAVGETGVAQPVPAASIRTGTVVPVGEVGTDDERIKSWNKEAAIRANEEVESFDIHRKGLVEATPTGYVAAFLDGIWLRAPYLHNGSVPTLRDLLKPVAERPKFFYRGYDVYDAINGGFISTPAQAQLLAPDWNNMKWEDLWGEVTAAGTPYDVNWRSNGNIGHEYGVNLPQADKDALLEYLKTL